MKRSRLFAILALSLILVPLGVAQSTPPVNPLQQFISKPLVPLLTPITNLLKSAGGLLGGLLGGLFNPPPPPPPPAATGKPVDMKLLVLATDGTEPGLAAMQYLLDRLGTPYQVVLLAKGQSLPTLDNGTKGYFQGIILTTGNLGICDPNCRSALTTDGWTALDKYASTYGVRTVSYYTFPDPRYGLNYTGVISTSDASPSLVSFASSASTVFPYLTRTSPIKVANSYMYLASTVQATGETTTPILTLGSSVVGVTHKTADGRESLALTMDNNPFLLHSQAFHYGLIKWVTKGIFLGNRKAFLSPQVDDLFLANDLFDPNTAACIPVGFAADPTFDPADQCSNARIAGSDLSGLSTWQSQKRSSSQFSQFKIGLAFNGFGATTAGGSSSSDSLVQSARSMSSTFNWVTHTYDHENLDCYNPVPNSGMCTPATQSQSLNEITQNVTIGNSLGLSLDSPSMVTPAISGLANPAFLSAAASQGIKYLIADLSRPEGTPAIPNTVIQNTYQPSILMIPRRPTNIFYNTDTDLTGVVGSEPDEYNYFYGPNGIFRIGGPGGPPFFTTTQSYQQIVDRESDTILGYMLQYEMYPLMYHQGNLRAYNGPHSIFTDVMDAAMSKFSSLTSVPVVSMKESDLGQLLADRLTYMTSQVQATLTPGQSIQITSSSAAKIPLTGVCSDGCASYGGDNQSSVSVSPNAQRTIFGPF